MRHKLGLEDDDDDDYEKFEQHCEDQMIERQIEQQIEDRIEQQIEDEWIEQDMKRQDAEIKRNAK